MFEVIICIVIFIFIFLCFKIFLLVSKIAFTDFRFSAGGLSMFIRFTILP